MAPTSSLNHLPERSLSDEAIARISKSSYLFGTSADWVCLSFMATQGWTYFRHSKKDSVFLKAIVYSVILFQLVDTGLFNYSAYYSDAAGSNTVDRSFLKISTIVYSTWFVLVFLTGFTVQCFFIWRIWTFTIASTTNSRRRMLIKVICAFMLLTSGLSLSAAAIEGSRTFGSNFFFTERSFRMMITIWGALSAFVDIIIAICMTVLLLRAKTSSVFGETRDLLSRLIRLIWQTGSVTAFLALLSFALNIWVPLGSAVIPISLLGKSYVISLLASLNARTRLNTLTVHGSGNNQESQATRVSTVVFAPPNHRREEGNIDSIDVSAPVHSSVQMCCRCQCQYTANLSADASEEQGAMSLPI